jgi:uncharacterized protein DUF6484
MKRKPTRERPTAEVAEAQPVAMRIGQLVAGSTPAALKVTFPGNGTGPLRARTTVALDAAAIGRAVASKRGVLLLFENGDPKMPIVVGLLEESAGGALLGELLTRDPTAPAAPVEARLDGKRVVLEGKEEVVLRCGEASITLRRDGKVLVRGAYIETQAKGINRIKGGAVKIN